MERHRALRSAAAAVSDLARRSRRNRALYLRAQRRDRARYYADRAGLELARIDPALDLSDRAAQGRPHLAAGGAVDFRDLHGDGRDRILDRHFAGAAAATLRQRRGHAI